MARLMGNQADGGYWPHRKLIVVEKARDDSARLLGSQTQVPYWVVDALHQLEMRSAMLLPAVAAEVHYMRIASLHYRHSVKLSTGDEAAGRLYDISQNHYQHHLVIHVERVALQKMPRSKVTVPGYAACRVVVVMAYCLIPRC